MAKKKKGEQVFRKPKNLPFKQQYLLAWQPKVSPIIFISTLFVGGIVFLVLGIVFRNANDKVKWAEVDYTDCESVQTPGTTCADKIAKGKFQLYTYMHMHTCKHEYIYIHTSMHTCIHTHIYIYIYIYSDSMINHKHTNMHTNMHNTCIQIYIYIHTCLYIYTYIHTEVDQFI